MKTKKKDPQAYTKEEVREMLFAHMKGLAEHWSIPMHREAFPTEQSRMLGLCFSILVMLDGDSAVMPKIDLVVNLPKKAKKWYIKQGEKYFEDGMCISENPLHESFKH